MNVGDQELTGAQMEAPEGPAAGGRAVATRAERQAALMALFRQQQEALAAEFTKQRSALMMLMDEPLPVAK